MVTVIQNRSCSQRLKDLDFISLVQWRLQGQLIEVYKYINVFDTSAMQLFDCELNGRTRNNGVKILYMKFFNTSVTEDFYQIKNIYLLFIYFYQIKYSAAGRWTLSRNRENKHWAENPQMSGLNGNDKRCTKSCRPAALEIDPTVCPTTTTYTARFDFFANFFLTRG